MYLPEKTEHPVGLEGLLQPNAELFQGDQNVTINFWELKSEVTPCLRITNIGNMVATC